MKTIRRIYFYLLSFIGLQLIVWGLFVLLSGIWTSSGFIGFQDILPTGLSLVLIGLPVFIIHFRIVQRDAASDPEENDSLVRAIFLFLTQITALGAIAISSVYLIDQIIRLSAHLSGFKTSTLLDQIAIVILNLLVWLYLYNYLLPDEDYFRSNAIYKTTRRVYRYIWLIAATATTVIALQGQLSDVFSRIGEEWIFNFAKQSTMKLSTIIIWTPIWAWTWNLLQKTYSDLEESRANIRYILNLCITIISMAPWLISGGVFLYNLLTRIFEGEALFNRFFYSFNIELSVLLPFFFLWLYYERQLSVSVTVLSDSNQECLIYRIYSIILSMTGNILTFLGIMTSILWIIDSLFNIFPEYGGKYDQLCSGIALFVIGLPLWIIHWKKVQKETLLAGKEGISARKSTLRRFYLYFFVFGSVIGIMGTAGAFFYNLLFIILGRHEPQLAHFIMSNLFMISLFVFWLIYHLRVMREDNKLIKESAAEEKQSVSILVLKKESDEELLDHLVKQIKVKFSGIHIDVQLVSEIPAEIDFNTYQIIILSTHNVANNKQKLELETYNGKVFLIPASTEKIIPIADCSTSEITKNVLTAINQINLGNPINIHNKRSALHIVAYVLGGLIAVSVLWQILFGILMYIAD
jgi:hypothetical protein